MERERETALTFPELNARSNFPCTRKKEKENQQKDEEEDEAGAT